uniref:Uncharacterized protein n=1 Tax=Arundo donax TaxID=35708 RepID=A0A0A9ECQ5_ARUDO
MAMCIARRHLRRCPRKMMARSRAPGQERFANSKIASGLSSRNRETRFAWLWNLVHRMISCVMLS